MTDKLDKLLNDFDNKSNQQKEDHPKIEQKINSKKEDFNSSFKILMTKTIRPTMSKLLDKMQEHGHNAEIHNDKKSRHREYIHENYLINYGQGKNFVLISLVGNHDHQKVFIYTQYTEQRAVKEIENSYEISEVSEELLENVVTEGVRKILK